MRLQIKLLSTIALLTTGVTLFAPKFPALFPITQALAQTPDARKAEADQLLQQGIEQYEASEFEAALQSWQQALSLYQEIKDRFGEWNLLVKLGDTYRSLGDYAEEIEDLHQNVIIVREIKDRKRETQSTSFLGSASLEDYAKAIEYYQQSLAIAREIKNRSWEMQSLGILGNAYTSLKDDAKAIDYHQKSLAIAREIKNRSWEIRSLSILGDSYYSLKDHAKEIEYLQQGLATAREIKDRQRERSFLSRLGSASYSLKDYAKTIDYYQQSLTIAKGIKDRLWESQSLSNLGDVYSFLGNYTKAIECLQQVLAIVREIKNRPEEGYLLPGEGYLLNELGAAYYYLGDYIKAIEYHQQSLAVAKGIKDRFEEGRSLNLDRFEEGRSLSNLGRAFRKSGNLVQAEKNLRAGIEVWESVRGRLRDNDFDSNYAKKDVLKVSIFEEQTHTYRLLQEVLIAQNQPTEALEVSERGRARTFVERLATRFSSPSSTGPNVSTHPPNIQQIQQIAQQQNATLVEYSIIYDEFKVQGKQEVRESELYIWVIPPSGVVSFRRVDLKPLWQQNTSLAELVINSRESIGVRGRGGIEVSLIDEVSQSERLQQLHQLLIQPIADLLPADPNARVIFIPQQSLFLVPFAALQDTNNKYLIEQHTILTAPSIQVLALTRQQRQRVPVSVKDVLVVGNPTMPSLAPKIGEKPQPLLPLPGAEKEALEIARLLNTTALTGHQATESAVVQKLPTAKMIHLATHGLLDDFQGLGIPGAIALTPTGKDDGFLTANEILNLKLNAELVVLSACDTGQGKLTGDGVIGLSRSLITAGVPSVIVTLWAIPDNPSALLMSEFYRNLQRNSDKAQALRSAMLTTMKQYPHQPSAWAAYTLIGEAE